MRTIEGMIKEIYDNDMVLLHVDKKNVKVDAGSLMRFIKKGQKVIVEYEDGLDAPRSCRIVGVFSII